MGLIYANSFFSPSLPLGLRMQIKECQESMYPIQIAAHPVALSKLRWGPYHRSYLTEQLILQRLYGRLGHGPSRNRYFQGACWS
jgi:hypothetical protein